MNKNTIQIPEPEKVEAWGMSHFSISPVLRPKSEEEIREIFSYANINKLKLTFRGGGCSYGDASINNNGIVVDMSSYNRILKWDESNGTIRAESGVTIKQLWEFSVEKSYWPPVVSGTMFPTLGGALSMNIHGKNNYAVGPLGEHIIEFTFLTPNGEVLTCTKSQNKEIFYSAISGMGMLGCFLEVTLKLKKIYSGNMKVTPIPTRNLEEMIKVLENNYQTSDYLVGWIDAFGSGDSIGRGLVHKADHLKEGEDKNKSESLKLKNQILPPRFFGVIPKSWMWIFMYPFTIQIGMRFVNFAKYIIGFIPHKPYLQSHAQYAFLLDYVPNWKFIYKPGSMIQYQIFLPKEKALETFRKIFSHCQQRKMVPFLAVFKKHRKDEFLLTHSVDGYSLALDFPVNSTKREKLWNLTYELDEIVLSGNGRFYFAKDSTMRPEIAERVFSKPVIEKFKALKKKLDPNLILESDQFRRVFGKG